MKYVKKGVVSYLDARLSWAYHIERPQPKLQERMSRVRVTLRFPMGELTNPAILGFVWAWRLDNNLHVSPIVKKDKFNAQGLEGAIEVRDISLVTALLAIRELPKYRWSLVADSADLKDL